MKRTAISLFFPSLFCSVCLISLAQARVITVDDDGSADYATIGAAIEAAANGDEIVVANGLYQGAGNRDLDFRGKQVNLHSEHGPTHCVIDCGGSQADPHRAFYVHSQEDWDTHVRGFTIINGVAGTVPGRVDLGRPGGAILCIDGSITIENCLFIANRADDGGAIAVFESGLRQEETLLVRRCTFSGNSAAGVGGALYAGAGGSLRLTDSISWNNRAGNKDEVGFSTADDGFPFVGISYCSIQGGRLGILRGLDALPDQVFIWDQGVYEVDPLFARGVTWDEEGNLVRSDEEDFHLQSQAGRWDPNQLQWVQDEVSSPGIDAGGFGTNGRSGLGLELWPHGARVNLGAYGGTLEASLSPSRIDMGDLNLDGLVDTRDIGIYEEELGSGSLLALSDLDRDTVVGPNDLAVITERFSVDHLPIASPQRDADPLVWRDNPDLQIQWVVEPHLIPSAEGFDLGPGQGLVSMTAETLYATDGTSVEYLFVDDDHPEVDSGWITFLVGQPVSWIDKVPDAEDTYHYRVTARNSGNEHETLSSEIIEVKPRVSSLFPQTPEWTMPPTAVGAGTIEMEVKQVVDLDDMEGEVWYYFANWLYDGVVETQEYSSGWIKERAYRLTGLANGEYRFSVKAGNGPFSEEGEPIFQTDYSQVLGATIEWKVPPDDMNWRQTPTQLTVGSPDFGPGAIAMEVEPVFDPNGDPVEYYFTHWQVDGQVEGPHSSGWLDSNRYAVVGLEAGEYRFSVKARSKNAENDESSTTGVTVDRRAPVPSPMFFTQAPQYVTPGNATGTAAMTAVSAQDVSGGIQYWFDCTTDARFGSQSWQSAPRFEVLIGRFQPFRFRVKARDRFGNETQWSEQLVLQ